MAIDVRTRDDAALVLDEAGPFLASDPILHNLVLTLLRERALNPEPGRYWLAIDQGDVVGVVFQSPLHFVATTTPMPPEAVSAVVDAIADEGAALPGVNGEAATVARFAGQWTERHRSGAAPVGGQRIYEVTHLAPPPPVSGGFRTADPRERDLLVEWLREFNADVGDVGYDPAEVVDRRLPRGAFWLWDDDGPVSLAAHSVPVAGVARINAVYTPPDRRCRGYASACVAALSRRLLEGGHRCILYTDMANPTSNSVYRRIGYQSVAEMLSYAFS